MASDIEGQLADEGRFVEIPLTLRGQTVYLSVRELSPEPGAPLEEREISHRQLKLEQTLNGLGEFAKEIVDNFQDTGASKVAVEFGCEFALESGSIIAVIGKLSSKSILKIGLEWTKLEA